MKVNKVRDSRTLDSTAEKRIISIKRQLSEQEIVLDRWTEILIKHSKDKSIQRVGRNRKESQRRKILEIKEALRRYEEN